MWFDLRLVRTDTDCIVATSMFGYAEGPGEPCIAVAQRV